MPYLFQKRGIRVIYKGSIFVQKSIAVNPQRICKCHRYIVLNGVSVILIQNQCRGHNANLFCQFPCGEALECPVILQILARCGAFFIGFVVKGQMNHDFAFRIEVNPCVIEITIGKSKTQKQTTDVSSTDSIPFREFAAARPPERKGRDAMSAEEMQSYRELILENIEYDHLCREFETYREDLDEIVELIVETVCARRKTTRIAGADFPHEVVRSRFLKLDSSHIEFVMESLHNNTTEVRNIKQYLLTVLFNAPTTMNNHYTAQVNHDMHAGGW